MMIILDEAVPYILFQRTEYLLAMKSPLLNRFVIRVPSRMYNLAVRFEAMLTKSRVKRLFQEDMQHEYEVINPYLPQRARAILDIGCGVAGIDMLLYEHYWRQNQTITLCLLDKTEMPKSVYYGFEKNGSYYNSLAVARDMLVLNGVAPEHILTQEVSDDYRITFKIKFDLVISLISWGFHYPLATYLNQVYELLKPDGVLILDVRKDSHGMEQIERKFDHTTVICEARKYIRIMAWK